MSFPGAPAGLSQKFSHFCMVESSPGPTPSSTKVLAGGLTCGALDGVSVGLAQSAGRSSCGTGKVPHHRASRRKLLGRDPACFTSGENCVDSCETERVWRSRDRVRCVERHRENIDRLKTLSAASGGALRDPLWLAGQSHLRLSRALGPSLPLVGLRHY